MKQIEVGGIELAVVDRGAGIPLVLVHGFPLDHRMWQGQIDGLASDCRVIAPDLRGFGQSGVTRGSVTMAEMADDLEAMLDGLGIGERVVVCGLSMGGYVAWQFFARHPQRLGGLVLCDTRALPDSPEAARGRRETADRVVAEGTQILTEGMIPKLFAKKTLADAPDLIEQTRRVILSMNPEGIAAAARGMAERPDATPLLPRITCPVLVIVGCEDVISPVDEMRAIAERIPHARLVEIAGAGHMAPLERPEQVNRAIREFLAECVNHENRRRGPR